ncbi:MAG: porin, partial [bacterium]
MKMVKSLLLGSAAGVVAVATGQAADLPVKAKPVEYVKVCSLYGAGFFYIPGTDKCIKIGGLLREQYDIHGAGDGQAFFNTTSGTWTRGFTNDSSFRTRSVFTVDVREQSSFGTVRAYTAFGAQQTTPNDVSSALYFTRSFVQFAGFTAGRAVSFFDFISFDPYGYSNVRPNLGNTGATGINVLAYTAQLGNGVSATVSAEDNCAANTAAGGSPGSRGCFVVNTNIASALAPGVATYSPQGHEIPDVVGSL